LLKRLAALVVGIASSAFTTRGWVRATSQFSSFGEEAR
jgi:hypothetical protein